MILILFANVSPLLACLITPAHSLSTSHTCGLPRIVSASNTSSGNHVARSKFWWKINSEMYTDTIVGASNSNFLLKDTGVFIIRMYSMDTTGCIDSSTSNITVNSNAKHILDQNLSSSFTPKWINCLQSINDPDSFRIYFQSSDTLKNLKIFWGDGNSDLSGNNLSPNISKTHLYTSLGIYELKIVTSNGNCIDTVYGTVYNISKPSSGITGPLSGTNSGCAPLTLRIINNSNKDSKHTKFTIDWGNNEIQNLNFSSNPDTVFHTYKAGKTVCNGIIKITATNVCGNSSTTWSPVDVSEKDKSLFTYTPTCNPLGFFTFTNLATDKYCQVPDIKEFYWDFGDNSNTGWIYSKNNQLHNYSNEGLYTVKLITKTACGKDTFQMIVPVFYGTTSLFKSSTTRGCKPLNLTLTDTSIGKAYKRLWTINSGNITSTSTDSILNLTLNSTGNHNITLTVYNKCDTSSITKTYVVKDKPKAILSGIPSACVPAIVNFLNSSTSYFNNPTYTWDFGDGSISNLKNPAQKIYKNPDNYSVKLIIKDSCGSDSVIQNFTAYSLPNAILSGDTSGCTNDSLTIRNSSLNASTYSWDFGNNYAQTKTDTGIIKMAYSTQGSYMVKLIAISSFACKDTTEMTVGIRPGAKSLFALNKSFDCSPTTFKVSNNSLYAQSYKWFANNKLISNNFIPNDTTLFSDSTIVNLKLVATSSTSCKADTFTLNYFTPKNPKAIIANNDSGCGPLMVNFNNTSTFSSKYFWTSGISGNTSVTKSPSFTYQSATFNDTSYTAKLLVSNWAGCKDSTTKIIKVYPIPTAQFTVNKTDACGPMNVTFTNNSVTNSSYPNNSLSHQWLFAAGDTSYVTSPLKTFTASKTKDSVYHVILTTQSNKNCKNQTSMNLRVYPQPKILFNPDKYSGCESLNVQFNNNSSPNDTGSIAIMKFKWDLGNGQLSTLVNPSTSYGASIFGDTFYQIKLIGETEHGCKDSSYTNITVHPDPIAKFSTNKTVACTPIKISTNNTSFSPDAGPITHYWNFGNSYISTSVNDSSAYVNNTDNDISYTITYIASSQYGCKDTQSLKITAKPQPKSSFTVNTTKVCAPGQLIVTDISTNAKKHYWSAGATTFIGNSIDTLFVYGEHLIDSVYTLSHFVESDFGCYSDVTYRQVIVLGKPLADFNFYMDSTCINSKIHFINQSLGSVKSNWNFGDGSNSVVLHPIHSYPTIANNFKDTTFKIGLEAISSYGCKDTVFKDILLINKPSELINMDQASGCSIHEIKFSNASSDFKTLSWDFGDNTTRSDSDTITHTYTNQSGNLIFQPKITLIRSRYNCFDTASTNASIYPLPSSKFRVTRTDPCNDGKHLFSNNSLNSNSADWQIDGQYINSNVTFRSILTASESKDTFFNVKLFSYNAYGCADTSEQIIKVKPKLKVSFTLDQPISCENAFVNFTNTSSNTVRNFWDFDDGDFNTDIHPSHSYNKYGNYQVKLYGYDKDGCVDSAKGSVTVLERPNADFIYDPLSSKLPNSNIHFYARPKIYGLNIDDLSFDWNFGDNSYPTANKAEKDPNHTYLTSGYKAVTFRVSNNGCEDSITKFILIEEPDPTVDFTADVLEGCQPLKIKFNNDSKYANSYRWIFGDGSAESNEISPEHIYQFPGTFNVTLIASGLGGVGSLRKDQYIKVNPKPFVDFYTNLRFISLPDAVFNMVNNSNSDFNEWRIFDSTGYILETSHLSNPSFIINNFGLFDIQLIGTNADGCSDTMYKTDYIGAITQGFVYVPDAFSPDKNKLNDELKPSLFNVLDNNYIFEIYNRWGEMVFQTNNINASWDGTLNGKLCQQDVYIWRINGEFINHDLFSYRGTVSLLR